MLSGEVKKPDGYCAACRKHFNTEGAFENHLKSKKHKESAAAFDKRKDKDLVKNNRMNRKPSESVEDNEDDDDGDMEVEEVDSDEWDEEGEGEPGMHGLIGFIRNELISGPTARSDVYS